MVAPLDLVLAENNPLSDPIAVAARAVAGSGDGANGDAEALLVAPVKNAPSSYQLTSRAEEMDQGPQSLKERGHFFFHEPESSKASMWMHLIVMGFIVFSVSVFLLQTLPDLDPSRLANRDTADWLESMWWGSEAVCIVIFTVEYLGRLCTARQPLKWSMEFMNVIDFLAVAPFYVHQAIEFWDLNKGEDTSALVVTALLRVLRLLRAFRILKLGKYFTTLRLVAETMKRSATALVTLLFIALLINVIFSAAIFFAEGVGQVDSRFCWVKESGQKSWEAQFVNEDDDNYDYCKGFESIPSSMWWTLVTITTLGYGDVYPRTAVGKLVGTFTALSGILALALPITVVGANFTALYEDYERKAELEKMGRLLPLVGEDRTPYTLWRRGMELAKRHLRSKGSDLDALEVEAEVVENARARIAQKRNIRRSSMMGDTPGGSLSATPRTTLDVPTLPSAPAAAGAAGEAAGARAAAVRGPRSFRLDERTLLAVDDDEDGVDVDAGAAELEAEMRAVLRRHGGARPGLDVTLVMTTSRAGRPPNTVVMSTSLSS